MTARARLINLDPSLLRRLAHRQKNEREGEKRELTRTRHIQHPPRPLIRLPKRHIPHRKETGLPRPLNRIEPRSGPPSPPDPLREGFFTGGDSVGEGGDEESAEFGVRAGAEEGGDCT